MIVNKNIQNDYIACSGTFNKSDYVLVGESGVIPWDYWLTQPLGMKPPKMILKSTLLTLNEMNKNDDIFCETLK